MAELISDNAEQRAFTAAAMNTLQCKSFSLLLRSHANNSKIHSQHGFLWCGSNKSTNPTVRSTLPSPTFRCADLKIVTPGNRAAAVVGGFNVIVFTIIAILDHREKKQKRKNGELTRASILADSPTAGSVDGSEKRLPLGDVEDVSPVRRE
jgi:MFS transporter, ACS family, pantothenate transporter